MQSQKRCEKGPLTNDKLLFDMAIESTSILLEDPEMRFLPRSYCTLNLFVYSSSLFKKKYDSPELTCCLRLRLRPGLFPKEPWLDAWCT